MSVLLSDFKIAPTSASRNVRQSLPNGIGGRVRSYQRYLYRTAQSANWRLGVTLDDAIDEVSHDLNVRGVDTC
jgi:hypothetical protein